MHSDLWRHALTLYARPGVEEACLMLQDQGADVCLLLCGTWLQAQRVAPEPQRLDELRQLTGRWQREVVSPLRTLRRQWREQARADAQLAALREQVKRLELEAERTLLERLQDCASKWPASAQGRVDDWLNRLAPAQALGSDALSHLRAAAMLTQDVDEGG